MATAVEILSRSANTARVVVPNASDPVFPTVLLTADAPSLDSSRALTPGTNGAWMSGGDGYANNLLWLQPLCQGAPGSQFSLQVWGYRHQIDGQNQSLNVFVPAFLCELACAAGPAAGVVGGSVLDTENLCDTIALAAGSLGPLGEIVSPATDPLSPRPGLPGFAVVNLRGSRFFRVVFQQADPVLMNALWAPLSQ